MQMKVHVTGYAVAYETGGAHIRKGDPERPKREGRYQGSLFNQQKRAVADAVEWIRRNSRFKPRIFVVTTPGFIDHPAEGKFIQKLVHNLKNGYGMGNFVWVRELTKNGYPHWHFVADIDQFDPVRLSVYWSGLFGITARNSIRLGTRPHPVTKKRKFWITGPRMAWYMCKYMGKEVGSEIQKKGERKTFRTFAISEEARRLSSPAIYIAYTTETWQGLHQRTFHIDDEFIATHIDAGREPPPPTADPRQYRWKWTGHGQTYVGFRKKEHNDRPVKTQ